MAKRSTNFSHRGRSDRRNAAAHFVACARMVGLSDEQVVAAVRPATCKFCAETATHRIECVKRDILLCQEHAEKSGRTTVAI